MISEADASISISISISICVCKGLVRYMRGIVLTGGRSGFAHWFYVKLKRNDDSIQENENLAL